jgi:phage shock protein B
LVGVVGVFLLRGTRLASGGARGRVRSGQVDEAQLIQELHQGVVRMEQRIEALETLLLERERYESSSRL